MNKIKLHILFFLFSNFCVAQLPVGKYCQISYKIGHYNFGDAGEFQKQEIFKFEIVRNRVVLKEFIQISNSYIYNPETEKNNLKTSDTIIKILNKKLKKQIFQELLISLSENENNFAPDFIRNHLPKKIAKKNILKIAKEMEKDFWFVDDETGKLDEFGRARIKHIQNFSRFDEFIKLNKPNVDEYRFTYDAWNTAQISVYGSNSIYRLDFMYPFGQPIYHHDENEKKSQTINLKSNLILIIILPNSLLSKEADLENIIERYIYWYIDKMGLEITSA